MNEKKETKVVDLSDMVEKFVPPMVQLEKWLAELIFPGKVEDFFEIFEGESTTKEISKDVCFYTDEHTYRIVAVERAEDEGYLGCNVLSRKKRPGETWIRGNDLPDGPFNKETWNKIIYAIVNYELVKLSPFRKPDELPPDIA